MYSTCLFCHRDLGRNDAVEELPIGRKLAFDPAKGRLWVVCARCERWNLTPIEERWEAIERCERRFHDTRIRVSTENIGLARLRDGTELVRIGEPLRPEFAAWRYTSRLRRRRRNALLVTGVAVVGAAGAVSGLAAVGALGGMGGLFNFGAQALHRINARRIVYRPEGATGPDGYIRRGDLRNFRWVPAGDEAPWRLVQEPRKGRGPSRTFEGPEGLRLAAAMLAVVNRTAGSRKNVADAVDYIEQAGNPFDADPSTRTDGRGRIGPDRRSAEPSGLIHTMPAWQRLAFELAANEAEERRYLAGELSLLERAWKEAEAIAAIADDLLVPAWVRERLGG